MTQFTRRFTQRELPRTATRKVKRGLMYDKFGDLVEEMYDSQEDRLVAAAVGGA